MNTFQLKTHTQSLPDGETTTFPASPEPVLLGELVSRHHDVSGRVHALGRRRLRVTDFTYDGSGPDAFFWVGTVGDVPGDNGTILPVPFDGTFFDADDLAAPVLERRYDTETVELSLPPHLEVDDLRWISVWCRKFSVSFGDLAFVKNGLEDDDEEKEEEEEEETERKIVNVINGAYISEDARH